MAELWEAWKGNTRARRLVSGLGGVGAAVFLLLKSDGEPLAAVLIHHGALGAQLLARAIWWANLVLGEFLALSSSSSEQEAGSLMVLGCGIAVIAVDRQGLAEATKRDGYNPVAFRGTLILAMIFALADTQSLLLFVLVSLKNQSGTADANFLTGCAIAMVVAFVGLYRLAWWGIVGNIAANVAVAVLALGGGLGLPPAIVAMLVTTAVLQLVVPIPMLVSILRRKPLPVRLAPSHRATITVVVVTALILLAAYAAWLHTGKLIRF